MKWQLSGDTIAQFDPTKYKTKVEVLCQSYSGLLFWAGLVTIILLGLVQASIARSGDSLSLDEPFTANVVHLPLPEIIEVFQEDNASSTHYLLLKLWTQIFGESEFALRSLSLLFFGLTILIVGLTGQQLTDWQGGLIAALLISTSWLGLEHAGNARQYALLCLLVSLSTFLNLYLMGLFSKASDSSPATSLPGRNISPFLLLIVLNVIGLLTHPIYFFFVCAYLFGAIFNSRRLFLILVLCSVASGGIYLGLWGSTLYHTLPLPITNWMTTPGLTELRDAFIRLWGFGPRGMRNTYLLAAYSLGITLFHFRPGVKILTGKPFLTSFGMLGMASLLPFIVSQYRPVFLAERTPVIFLPLAALVISLLIRRLGFRSLTAIILAVLIFSSVRYSVQALRSPDPNPARASIQYILDRVKCGDVLILGSLSINEVEYYLRRFEAPDCIQRETFPLETRQHSGWIDVSGLLKEKEALTKEAALTVARYADQPKVNVWLFYGYHSGEVTSILKSQLDRQMTLVQALDLSGSFFNAVLIYSTNPTVSSLKQQ